MSMQFAGPDPAARPIFVLEPDDVSFWAGQQPDRVRHWVESSGFKGALGTSLVIPSEKGGIGVALVGYGTADKRARQRFCIASARAQLPPGTYDLAQVPNGFAMEAELLGWLLAGYTFSRYHDQSAPKANLQRPQNVDASRIEVMAESEALIRDLINTPAADMGPVALEDRVRALAAEFDADLSVTTGDALLAKNFPMIHAVGRAAAEPPRLIDMRWGDSGPMLTLVGKGVCFDTGGLNLKPGSSMGLMKKDMGGAANVLGLARMIMELRLRLRLRVLIPAVENSVSSNSFRPQDILASRKGLTVEINNTDAEGRLVLADALALAVEDKPNLLISMATLTGAARVAVGPDLAPYFTDDDTLSIELDQAARRVADPVWRLPFHTPYEPMIEPGIADLDNAPSGGMAGAITAALFLRRFVEPGTRYAHFDIYGWQPNAAPGRSKGGFGQGPRAILEALPAALNL